MAWSDRFRLGPLGAMRPLPSPPHGGGVKVTPVRRGGARQPLLGPAVTDLWSVRRRYEFTWSERYAREVSALLMAWNALDRRPLRLFDPMHGANLMSLDASVAGGQARTLASFVTNGNPVTFVSATDLPAELVARDDLSTMSGVLRWPIAASAGETLLGADYYDPAPRLGQPLTVSVYVRGSGGKVSAGLDMRTAAGVFAGTTWIGPEVTLSSTWQRASVTVLPEQSPTAVAGIPSLYALASGTAREVQSCAWQVEHGDAVTPWGPGGACPRVRFPLDGFEYEYLRDNRRGLELALEEV